MLCIYMFTQPHVFHEVLTSCIMAVLFTLAFLPSALYYLCCALVSAIVYKLYLLDSFRISGILDFHHHGT